jgi:hypothetical protein
MSMRSGVSRRRIRRASLGQAWLEQRASPAIGPELCSQLRSSQIWIRTGLVLNLGTLVEQLEPSNPGAVCRVIMLSATRPVDQMLAWLDQQERGPRPDGPMWRLNLEMDSALSTWLDLRRTERTTITMSRPRYTGSPRGQTAPVCRLSADDPCAVFDPQPNAGGRAAPPDPRAGERLRAARRARDGDRAEPRRAYNIPSD